MTRDIVIKVLREDELTKGEKIDLYYYKFLGYVLGKNSRTIFLF